MFPEPNWCMLTQNHPHKRVPKLSYPPKKCLYPDRLRAAAAGKLQEESLNTAVVLCCTRDDPSETCEFVDSIYSTDGHHDCLNSCIHEVLVGTEEGAGKAQCFVHDTAGFTVTSLGQAVGHGR